MLNQLQTQRQLLFDLTANYLEPLPDAFSRLAYLSGLRDSTGKYTHDRLATVYTPALIDEVVSNCHEELFERLLEVPLSGQEKDLRKYLHVMPGPFEEDVLRHSKLAVEWIPPAAPSYLKELYCSNLHVLAEVLLDNKPRVR